VWLLLIMVKIVRTSLRICVLVLVIAILLRWVSNSGIAHALRIGIEYAKKYGPDWSLF